MTLQSIFDNIKITMQNHANCFCKPLIVLQMHASFHFHSYVMCIRIHRKGMLWAIKESIILRLRLRILRGSRI